MMKQQQSPLRRRYRNFAIMVQCWGALMIASLLIAAYTRYKIIGVVGIAFVGPLFAIFLIVKSLDFRCPKCRRRYDMRSLAKFCPHCGAALEEDGDGNDNR